MISDYTLSLVEMIFENTINTTYFRTWNISDNKFFA
jgi:hypothetical protein